jgi:hypothetical protein
LTLGARVTREDIETLAASLAPIVAAEVAREVIDRIEAYQDRQLLDAAELARVLGVDRQWVYDHQRELGAKRLGNGRKPRLRFELTRAVDALDELRDSGRAVPASGSEPAPVPRPRNARRRRR